MKTAGFCFAILVASVIYAAVGQTQGRPTVRPPDLSGPWTAITTDEIASSPLGPEFTVMQDAATITLVGLRGTVRYRLDGSETQRTENTASGAIWTLTSQARFVTAALLVTTKYDAGVTGRWEDLLLLSLDTPEQLTLVSSVAAKPADRGMNTTLFKYVRK